MDLLAATDYLGTSELLCDITVEQPVEGEFTIPDYQPEIFKIVKAKAEPMIVQKIAVGSKATVDGYIRLTVIYQTGEDKRLFSLTQKLPFSKQTDLKAPVGDGAFVLCAAEISYLNCRAVNSRRIDVRGAANIAIKVISGAGCDVICDIQGEGAHQRQADVAFLHPVAMDEKQFTLDEALAVDFEGCENPVILRCDAKAVPESVTIEDSRVILAGAVHVLLAVDISTPEQFRVKRAGFSLPYNQLLELEDISDGMFPMAAVSILSAGSDIEDDGVIGVSVLCAADVRVFEKGTLSLITDAFSTRYPLEMKRQNVSVLSEVVPVWTPVSLKQTVEKRPGLHLIDYYITPLRAALQSDSPGAVRLSLALTCLLSDDNGEIESLEQDLDVEVTLGNGGAPTYSALDVLFTTLDCTDGENAISLRADGNLFGNVLTVTRLPAVQAVSIDAANTKKPADIAVSIYFAEAGEDVFEIAKRFNTSPHEIETENNIFDGALDAKSMLLIPIVE